MALGFGAGIGAFTIFRQATSLACSSAAFAGSFAARSVRSDGSARRSYSSFRPSSKNSISFQSPARTDPAGVVRQPLPPAPR